MAIWTVEILTAHRECMGWPVLNNKIIKDVVYNLNSSTEEIQSISNVSWIEPAIHFSVAPDCSEWGYRND